MEARIYLLQSLIPILAVCTKVVFQLIISRFWIRSGTVIPTLISYGIGLMALVGIELQFSHVIQIKSQELLGLSIVGFIFYSTLAFLYFAFVNIGDTSVRIRILRELAQAGGTLTRAELLEKYSANHIIQARIERMLRTGEMDERNDRYYQGRPKLLLMAKTFQKLKRLFLGKNVRFKSFSFDDLTLKRDGI